MPLYHDTAPVHFNLLHAETMPDVGVGVLLAVAAVSPIILGPGCLRQV